MADLGEMPRCDAVIQALGPLDGKRVVDIGCGEGAVAQACARAGAEVRGYDPFIPGTGWIDEGAGRYRLTQARADAIPEADASADVVLFVYSLHHIAQARMGAALSEARRVLKPGGRLCVAEPIAEGPAQYVMEPYHDERQVRLNAIAAIAEHARPAFSSEQLIHFAEVRSFADFGAYADQAIANMRYNDYTEADVLASEVERRFAQVAGSGGVTFSQPGRINLFA